MKSSRLRVLLTALILTIATSVNAQTSAEKIEAKWAYARFEPLCQKQRAEQIQNKLRGVVLTFEKDKLMVSQKNSLNPEEMIKWGPYKLTEDGNTLVIGKDAAEIVLLNDREMAIRIEGQGIIYFIKQENLIP